VVDNVLGIGHNLGLLSPSAESGTRTAEVDEDVCVVVLIIMELVCSCNRPFSGSTLAIVKLR
jgi:hypothetical protein